jgi:hypothetical protein
MKAKYIVAMLLSICILIALGLGTWLKMTTKSVIWSYKEPGAAAKLPAYVIFNPFRERRSEMKADEILSSIDGGHCNEIISELPSKDRYRSLCENIHYSPRGEWKLVFREDNANAVTLFYVARTPGEKGFSYEMLITLDEDDNGKWRLVDLGPIY